MTAVATAGIGGGPAGPTSDQRPNVVQVNNR